MKRRNKKISLQKSGISDKSSASEILSVLNYSFRKEIYKEVERLLEQREGKLKSEVEDLRQKVLRAETKEMSVSRELKSCRAALEGSQKQVHVLRATAEQACKRHSKSQRQLESVLKELEKMEEEKEKMNEIAKANEEALEKLRMDGKKNLEDDCEQMDVEAEGGLPVSSSKGHLTTEDLQNVISAAVRNAITTLIPAAVTNRSLPLEASSGINDQNEARNVDQITPEALGEAIRPRIPAPISSPPLSPQAVPSNNRSSRPRENIEIEGENSDSQNQKRQRSIP